MSEPTRDEQEVILHALRDNATAARKASEHYEAAIQESRRQLYALIARGKAAGLGRRAMAKAAGLSLPSLSEIADKPPGKYSDIA
jgi:hypothetical protein